MRGAARKRVYIKLHRLVYVYASIDKPVWSQISLELSPLALVMLPMRREDETTCLQPLAIFEPSHQ